MGFLGSKASKEKNTKSEEKEKEDKETGEEESKSAPSNSEEESNSEPSNSEGPYFSRSQWLAVIIFGLPALYFLMVVFESLLGAEQLAENTLSLIVVFLVIAYALWLSDPARYWKDPEPPDPARYRKDLDPLPRVSSSSGTKSKRSQTTTSPKGWVYVATNPNIEGLVKIGYTERTVKKRMKELSSSTGVPGEYKAIYKFKATDPEKLEKKVHQRLSGKRVQRGGEFFKISPKKAARVIKKMGG